MSSSDCKRQKLADVVNSVAKMSKVSPKKDIYTQTDDVTIPVSASKELTLIDVNARKFEDIAKLDGFVDRTMLIEELLHGQKKEKEAKVMIFAPSKFGKTINLDMIRLFCEIEDKKTKTKEDVANDRTMEDLRSNPSQNMKVFLRQFEGIQYEECLILKREQFVIQHFGRHPVVLLNFKECTVKSKSEAIWFCAEQVRNAYKENKYLENSEELQLVGDIETCKDWMNYSDVDFKSLFLEEVMYGLENLIKSLRIHWGRKPVLLVDEFDKPCVAAMESELVLDQVREIGTVITNVVCSILKTGDELLQLKAALVTGICKFVSYEQSSMDNTTPVYFLSDPRFSKYYGLTAQEVDTLVKRLCGSQGDAEKTNKIISDINVRYNGYYQRFSGDDNKKEAARYCVFSLLNYMKDTNMKVWTFWSDGGFLTGKLQLILRKSVEIMSDIQILVYGDSGTIEITYKRAIGVEHILGLYRKEMKPNRDEVFNFFLQRGYLAHNVEKPTKSSGGNVKIYVRIPNLEIKTIFENMFELYYKSLANDIQLKLTSCGEFFKSLPNQNSTEFQKGLGELCTDLKCIFKNMECRSERTICGHIVAILKHYAGYDDGEMEKAVKFVDDKDQKQHVVYIDVWGRHGDFAIIFEVKFNPYATDEPGKIGSTKKSSLAAAEDLVKLLPGKETAEGGTGGKAGTGRNLQVLKSPTEFKKYVLIGLAVDGDHTTHMLVFRDTSEWENVIQVNPEKHVAKLISTHVKLNKPVV